MKRWLLVMALMICWAITTRAQVACKQGQEQIDITIGGQPFTTFHYGAEWGKPFLQPLWTAAGVKITRGFPLAEIAGESRDHLWHRGLLFGHGNVNGVDFWREIDSKNPKQKFPLPLGRLVERATPSCKGGRTAGTLTAELELVTADAKRLGSVQERFTFRRAGTDNIIDAQITIRADQGLALKLGDTEEGGLALRFADAFRQDRGATLTNSDGLTGTEKIWGKRAKWVDYSTLLDGAPLGVTIFDHPRNPKHPTWWHARPYGLNAANPFGERDFTGDKTRDGSITIAAGDKLVLRYRVVLHPGPADAAAIERHRAAFANGK